VARQALKASAAIVAVSPGHVVQFPGIDTHSRLCWQQRHEYMIRDVNQILEEIAGLATLWSVGYQPLILAVHDFLIG
jgi:hypothetical protein